MILMAIAVSAALDQRIDEAAKNVEPKVIECRRDIHQHPELGNREFRTSKLVADRLRQLGIEVRTPIAHTGVVGVLRGGKPGRVVGLRADMDALPVTEQVDLPFKSTARTTYNGQEVGVMHACGHDAHVAILLGVAEVLSSIRSEIPGTVVFLFQPAEEGAPQGEEGGAALMVKEGALDNPKVDAVFGLHVTSRYPVGEIAYRPGPELAAVDSFFIKVHGKQTHGAYPWLGVDPIVVASQIVLALQLIPSRQLDVSLAPAVVTVGAIHGGVRNNIIPDDVEMLGTIRSLDAKQRNDIHQRIKRTAEDIAASAGAKAEVAIETGYPITYNDPALTERLARVLKKEMGAGNVVQIDPLMVSEDFGRFGLERQIPVCMLNVGAVDPAKIASGARLPSLHSSEFAPVPEPTIRGAVKAMTLSVLELLR